MNKSNVIIGMFVGIVLVMGIVLFLTTKAKTTDLEIISLEPKPLEDTTEKIGTLEKVYTLDTETVTIKDYDTKTNLATIKLDTPIDYQVGAGYQKVAQFTVSPYTDISSFIKSIELYNLNNNLAKFSRTIDIKYLSKGTKLVNDYKTECTDTKELTKNGTKIQECKEVISGSHYEDEWINYTGELKSLKPITLGLFTEVQINDKVEWIPTFTISSIDIKVPEWATWTQDLKTNLNLHYDCEDSTDKVSGTLNFQANEGTMNYTSNGALSALGKACRFTSGNNVYLNSSSLTNIRNNIGTMNFWIRIDDVTGAEDYIWSNYGDWDANQVLHNANYLYSTGFIDGGAKTSGGTFTNNQWYMITYLHNSTGAYIYRNGTIMYSGAITTSNLGDDAYKFGTNNVNGNDFVGYLDEISFWGRALTDAEIQQLYNSGNGISYSLPMCNFSGYVKDSSSSGIENAQIVIFNQNNKTELYNTTSDSNGFWSKNITNSTSNFTAVAYFNNTLIGSAKPFISGKC